MVWGRQKWYVKPEKWIKRSWTKYGQRPGRWAVSRNDELVWERKLEERYTNAIHVEKSSAMHEGLGGV